MAGIKKGQILDWPWKGKTMTDDIQEFYFDSIIANLKVSSSQDVFKKLSEHTSNLIGTSQKFLYETLTEQEAQDSPGVGNGVAITHMRLPRLTKPFIIFAKLNNSVDFQSLDNEPVDMVCMVLSPDFEGAKHLSRLAQVSRIFNNKELCYELRETKDKEDIKMVMRSFNERKMAA